MDKKSTYDDISEVIKERVDNFELKDDIQEERLSIEAMPTSIMKEPSFPANSNPYYQSKYASKDTMEIIDAILFQEEKQPKDNHPYGWYRKFDKKRY